MTGTVHRSTRSHWRNTDQRDHPEPPANRHPAGRACPDCGRRLNTYNPGPHCYRCDDAHTATAITEGTYELDDLRQWAS